MRERPGEAYGKKNRGKRGSMKYRDVERKKSGERNRNAKYQVGPMRDDVILGDRTVVNGSYYTRGTL